MRRIGTRNNMIKQLMILLGNEVSEGRIIETMDLLKKIQEYKFRANVPVFFYYDEFIDDELCLTENSNEVDWNASLVVKVMLSNKKDEGFGIQIYNK